MKHLSLCIICLISSWGFSQVNNANTATIANHIANPNSIISNRLASVSNTNTKKSVSKIATSMYLPPPKYLSIAISYGYNSRSFTPDFYYGGLEDGILNKASHLVGHMPKIEIGYDINVLFKYRMGGFLSFGLPFTNTYSSANTTTTQRYNTRAWLVGAGLQAYLLSSLASNNAFAPYLKAAFNMGKAEVERRSTNNISNNTSGFLYSGGNVIGTTLTLGADVYLGKNFYLTPEIDFAYLNYNPTKRFNYSSGDTQNISTDLSDALDPNFGFIYTSQNAPPEVFRMNFISYRIGIRYKLFKNEKKKIAEKETIPKP